MILFRSLSGGLLVKSCFNVTGEISVLFNAFLSHQPSQGRQDCGCLIDTVYH